MDWHVLYLHPRCEKKMAEFCDVLDLHHYLPLRRETKIYQRRKVTVDKPVFPGYFFCAFDNDSRISVLQTNIVARVLEVPHQRSFLHELAQIRKALAIDPTLWACEAVRTGTRVRITGGPFRGGEGGVTARKASTKVLLNIDMIGQAVAVEIGRDLLEVTD